MFTIIHLILAFVALGLYYVTSENIFTVAIYGHLILSNLQSNNPQ